MEQDPARHEQDPTMSQVTPPITGGTDWREALLDQFNEHRSLQSSLIRDSLTNSVEIPNQTIPLPNRVPQEAIIPPSKVVQTTRPAIRYSSVTRSEQFNQAHVEGRNNKPQCEPSLEEKQKKEALKKEARVRKEVEDITARTIAQYPEAKWIARDFESVRGAVFLVKGLREKAKEMGLELSDRELYVRCRRFLDDPSLDDERREKVTKDSKMILTLMGGKPSGTLQF